jgi:hypothetical protein
MRINECSCGCGGSSDKCAETSGSELNYMFFGNLETMKRMIDELVQMDRSQIDEILKNGHEWAVDHIASSSDDIQEVYNFLKNHTDVPAKRKMDPFSEEGFLKTFESYISESSNRGLRGIETDLGGRNLDRFASQSHSNSSRMIWKSLTDLQRANILVSLELDGIEDDIANEYSSVEWTELPDYIKDRIDLEDTMSTNNSSNRTLNIGDVVKYSGGEYRIEKLGEPNSAGQVFHLGRSMSNNYTGVSIPQKGTWEKI